MVDVKFFVDLCCLRVKTLCSEDVCWRGQGARDSPCWCWADSQRGHSQSESDIMRSWFVCTCLRFVRLLNWELGPMIWLWLMYKESLLGNLNAWNQSNFLSQERFFFLWAECRRSNCIQSFCKDKIFEWGSIPTIMYMYLKYIKKFIAWSLSINYLHSIVVEREYLLANNMFFKSQLFWTERKQIVVKW